MAGTRVLTPRGLRRIEELRVGDEIWAFDLKARRLVQRRVAATLRDLATETFELRAGELGLPGVTASHPVYDAAAGTYARVDHLSMRSVLVAALDPAGRQGVRELPLSSVARSIHRAPVAVFNLSVEGEEQCYFAEGILVHNKSIASPDRDGDGWESYGAGPRSGDCDDDDREVNPGAREECGDGKDNDCDTLIDADDPDCEVDGGAKGDGGRRDGGALDGGDGGRQP